MQLLERIHDRARKAKTHIILAEGDDPRVHEAGSAIVLAGLASLTIIDSVHGFASLKPATQEQLIATLRKIRAKEALDERHARELLEDPRYLAATMLAAGHADGMVSGNLSTTAQTLRAALKVIGSDHLASSYFLMLKDEEALLFADCAVNIEPDAQQLATIAMHTAASARALGLEPRVALLSFSTKGSAQHPSLERIRDAVKIVREREPTLEIDGELQFDAAFDEHIGQRKGSSLGRANVFIFPDLSSANLGYKIAQRMGGWRAIGPILQGLHKPVADLSRGCSAQDIVDVVALLAACKGGAHAVRS